MVLCPYHWALYTRVMNLTARFSFILATASDRSLDLMPEAAVEA
jgi:hypothetical protein